MVYLEVRLYFVCFFFVVVCNEIVVFFFGLLGFMKFVLIFILSFFIKGNFFDGL